MDDRLIEKIGQLSLSLSSFTVSHSTQLNSTQLTHSHSLTVTHSVTVTVTVTVRVAVSGTVNSD